ncbi:TatD family hydrolase [Paludibacter jiangxiensis]|uniref:TatD DNase family protein n=1 Tax=Paludibacter jiangxiensis TaxID=681398 RepID=A0A170ZKX1_9BACT|nr:TatD family hydrolase [Paludibacter jiangxiensis]GAT62776.1 TatD DNase family protein [Paludibacter jiangxiensis]
MITIYNLSPAEALTDQSERLISVGLHPWHVGTDWEEQLRMLGEVAGKKRVMLIGEAGLDKLCKTDFALQQTVFLRQIELSEEVQKPLIIHCVKAWPELIGIRKKMLPSVPWVIHGFRGKPELASQLLELGLYLSFGEKFNVDSLRITPLEKLCTETDESRLPIEEIYCKIAEVKGVSVEELLSQANRLIANMDSQFIDIHMHDKTIAV